MPIITIQNIDQPELKPYFKLTETQLRREGENGIIIAESPKVIHTALNAGYQAISLLCENKHITGDAADIIMNNPDIPVYTGTRELLTSLTGYVLTRGVLCAMKRPPAPSPANVLKNANRICVIYDICDTTNIGSIFRSAAAIGIDGIILSRESCDPFNRRSIRVSMGTVFQIPWAFADDILPLMREFGFISVSMALSKESIFLQDFAVKKDARYALILGSEGYGLPSDIIEGSDFVVKIPMHHGVDSLNVGAAAAVTFWAFRP